MVGLMARGNPPPQPDPHDDPNGCWPGRGLVDHMPPPVSAGNAGKIKKIPGIYLDKHPLRRPAVIAKQKPIRRPIVKRRPMTELRQPRRTR